MYRAFLTNYLVAEGLLFADCSMSTLIGRKDGADVEKEPVIEQTLGMQQRRPGNMSYRTVL
jgi:hypothetical protein